MKGLEAFLLIFTGTALLAVGAVSFIGASDALSDLEQTRASFRGLGGLVLDISDALGASDNAEYKELLSILRLTGIAFAIIGLVTVLYGFIKALK